MIRSKLLPWVVGAATLLILLQACGVRRPVQEMGGGEYHSALPDTAAEMSDSDRDGIPDADDKCPATAGVPRYSGCPIPDSDGDGVNDELDKCPDEPGNAADGCPRLAMAPPPDEGTGLSTHSVGRAMGSSSSIENVAVSAGATAGVQTVPRASLAYAFRRTIPLHQFRYLSVVIESGQLLAITKKRLAESLGEESAKQLRSDDTSAVEGFELPAAKYFFIRLKYDTSVFATVAEMPDTQQLDTEGKIEWRWQVYGKKAVQESQLSLYVFYANHLDSCRPLSSRVISLKVAVNERLGSDTFHTHGPLPPAKKHKSRGWLAVLVGMLALAAGGWLLLKRRRQMQKKIYFSYAWNDETKKLVSALYRSLQKAGIKVLRDEADLRYQGSITRFMTDIGKADFAIVVITDKYLKSKFCMFELYELYSNSGMQVEVFQKKIFPIRLEEIDLSNPLVQMHYIDFWEARELEMEQLLKDNITTLTEEQAKQNQIVKRIKDEIGNLLPALSDLNALTPEKLLKNDFAEMKAALRNAMQA